MKSIEIQSRIKEILYKISPNHEIWSIINAIIQAKGKPLLVGGAVRDIILNMPVKDIDIEVHALSLESLEHVLKQFAPVSLVGKAFGVLRIHGIEVDWSLPRMDSAGRHPQVIVDAHLSYEQAFRRRDLTMNAMGIDLTNYEIIDPFKGQEDIKSGILRTPDITLFKEDPLRFYRVMQSIGRFDMWPDNTLNDVCATMSLEGVAIERIEKEFEKLMLLSSKPSRGFWWLRNIGRLNELLPEIGALIGVVQEYMWHPEGDVFIHTMQTIDAAASIIPSLPDSKLELMYAALCHDLGKTTTTRIIKERIRSPGHELESARLAPLLLKRVMNNISVIETVRKLVRYHMSPGLLVKQKSSAAAYKRLAERLAPQASLFLLGQLAYADRRGRNPVIDTPLTGPIEEIDEFMTIIKRLDISHVPEAPLLHGRDIMDIVAPGPRMGMLLSYAYDIQINEGITDKNVLKERIQALLKSS